MSDIGSSQNYRHSQSVVFRPPKLAVSSQNKLTRNMSHIVIRRIPVSCAQEIVNFVNVDFVKVLVNNFYIAKGLNS